MKNAFRLACLMAICTFVNAQEPEENWNYSPIDSSIMVHGGTGLIQTPTSRMLSEGDLRLSYTDNDQYRYWSATIQLFPWFQSTVRYTDVRNRLYSTIASFSGNQTLKDKGIDAKFRLWKESYYLPEVSVGFRDFGGTGFFESEFIGLSKQVGNLSFHANLGWGYLGTSSNITNPLCELKDSFCSRPGGYSGRGGKIDYQRFFKGPAALFGGIEYQTPWSPLRLKLEYEGNNYVNDIASISNLDGVKRYNQLTQDSRWNFGANFRWNNFDFSLNYQRGNTVGFGVTYNFNLHTASQIKIDRPPRSITNQSNDFDINQVRRTRMIRDLYSQAGFAINDTTFTPSEVTIYGEQTVYSDQHESIERIGRIMASELPESVEEYNVVTTVASVPLLTTSIDADDFKAKARYQTLNNDLSDTYSRHALTDDIVEAYNPTNNSGFFTSVETFFIQTFGNPEDFYLYQGGLLLNAGYSFKGKTSLAGTVKVNLFENFDKFNFRTDGVKSPLPRVRTNAREYVSNRHVTMENLYLHWHDRIAPNVYAQVYAGYLESMYGGVGTELLYRPVDSNFAFGFDLNYVQQRSFENNLDFFDYKVLTGHANIYWRPWFMPDAQLTFNVGQYLAKDKGVTIDFAKRFESGIVVGAYAAFTNVSAEDYGEGSFTKGFYLSIPFDLFSITPAKGQGKLPWIPIARDGGQALIRPIKLYDTTKERAPF